MSACLYIKENSWVNAHVTNKTVISCEKGLSGGKPDRWGAKMGEKLIIEYFVLYIY